jgi:D-alanyl-D-alanine carboxypeptidase (penicillin-binding protein 5/6)
MIKHPKILDYTTIWYDARLPIASITKVMSMLLIMEALDSGKLQYDQILTASAHATAVGSDTSSVYMPTGEKNSVNDLLKAVAIHSANDATIVLAEQVGGTEQGFVRMMNDKAAELGMTNTNFLDSTGLTETSGSEKAYCSVSDVVIMARELMIKHPKILDYTTIWYDTFRNGEFRLDNTNKLINSNPWVNGLKTGFNTEAGYCLCATGEKNGVKVIAVVLGEESTNLRFAEALYLMEYGITNYETSVISKKDEIVVNTPLLKGVKTKINGLLEQDVSVTYKKGEIDKITKEAVMQEKLTAPVVKGQVIGEMVYRINGNVVGKSDITAETDIKKASWITLFFRMIAGWFTFGKK